MLQTLKSENVHIRFLADLNLNSNFVSSLHTYRTKDRNLHVRMKNIKLILLLIILLGTACSPTGKRHPAWKDMPVVARMETVNGHPLTVARLDLLNDTMNLPLSALVEEPALPSIKILCIL